MNTKLTKPLPKEDLAHVLQYARQDLEKLRGARVFVTGGTGFFGKWLLATFQHANRELRLDATMTVLTRDPARFRKESPHLADDPVFSLHAGDVRTFEFPAGKFSHVIHGASSPGTGPLEMFATIVDGSRRTLEFTAQSDASRFLFLGSGAVYGPQPSEITHVPETYHGAPNPLQLNSAYGEAKRAAEHLSCSYGTVHGFAPVIARCFAFAGPHLPLDGHFAIGNFIGDALAGRPISVQGDGTPYRSYLYAADLAVWLWALLVRGESGQAFNVGSDEDLTIAELARIVAEESAPTCEVRIAQPAVASVQPLRYVPLVERARTELGLEVHIKLREGIQRTLGWLR
jgi:nucleoside-diphosphate-sugar epimerase